MNRIFITLLSISIFTSCIKDEKVKTTYTYSNSSTKIVAISTVNNTDSLSANYIITPNDSFNKTSIGFTGNRELFGESTKRKTIME